MSAVDPLGALERSFGPIHARRLLGRYAWRMFPVALALAMLFAGVGLKAGSLAAAMAVGGVVIGLVAVIALGWTFAARPRARMDVHPEGIRYHYSPTWGARPVTLPWSDVDVREERVHYVTRQGDTTRTSHTFRVLSTRKNLQITIDWRLQEFLELRALLLKRTESVVLDGIVAACEDGRRYPCGEALAIARNGLAYYGTLYDWRSIGLIEVRDGQLFARPCFSIPLAAISNAHAVLKWLDMRSECATAARKAAYR